MDRLTNELGTVLALLLIAAAIFYVGTDSVRGTVICLLAEIGLWVVVRQIKNRLRQAQY